MSSLILLEMPRIQHLAHAASSQERPPEVVAVGSCDIVMSSAIVPMEVATTLMKIAMHQLRLRSIPRTFEMKMAGTALSSAVDGGCDIKHKSFDFRVNAILPLQEVDGDLDLHDLWHPRSATTIVPP